MAYAIESVLQEIPNVSCVEGDASSLFLGTDDGQLLHYVVHKDDPESDSLEYTYLLASRQIAPGGKPPRAITLLPGVQLAAVTANETLSFYSLPEFAPVSSLRVLKDVQGVVLNCDVSERTESDGSASITIYTKKKIRQIKVSRAQVKLVREVEYFGCIAACHRGSILCVATRSSYDLVDLDKKARIPLFPVVQGESEPVGSRYDKFLPRIISPSPEEFLLSSGSPESPTTMGMFITLAGEITRGTLMFDGYPITLVADASNIIALLPQGIIQVYDLYSQALMHTIEDPDVVDMYSSAQQIPVVSKPHLKRITLTDYKASSQAVGDSEKPASTDLNAARMISDVQTSLLLRKRKGIGALVTGTRLLTIDHDLEANRVQAALHAAEILARETPSTFAERLYHELAYIHQKCALVYFNQMLFDDALDHFKKGNIDPRVLISFFPEFPMTVSDARVFAGLQESIRNTPPVDQIIRDNLTKTVDDEATLLELEGIVKSNALELLRRHLTADRERKDFVGMNRNQNAHGLFSVCESTLLRILLTINPAESQGKLQAFFETELADPESVIDILKEGKQWRYLAELHAKSANHREALLIWQSLASHTLEDEYFTSNAVTLMKDYLLNFGNDELVWEFGLWLMRHSTQDGIQLFCQAAETRLVTFPIHNVLDTLRSEPDDSDIYFALLQHLVLVQKSTDLALINELMISDAHGLIQRLENEQVLAFLTDSIENYRSLAVPKVSYLTFVSESVVPNNSSLVMEFVAQRARFMDLLQSSAQYDAQSILDIILQCRDVLLAERILLNGRLSKHAESLNLMVHDLKDFDSAEVYCYSGGISLAQIRVSDKSETVLMRRKLFPLLFAEYLALQPHASWQGSNLLNRWGKYMDVAVVLELVPRHWSVETIGAFLLGAFSHLTGAKREAQIKRSLARAQLNAPGSRKFVILSVDGDNQ